MAFLGWNPGEEVNELHSSSRFANARVREIFAMPFLIKEFSLDNVQKSGAIFNIKKLDSLNGFYIRQKPIDKLVELCKPYLPKASKEELKKAIAPYQERMKKLSEIKELTDFFFAKELKYDKALLRWKNMDDKELIESLDKLEKILFKIEEGKWTKENLEKVLMAEAEKMGDRGFLLWPLRAALTGKEASAGPFEIAEILGKQKTLTRIKQARGLIK